jgi:outer membrane lipoprotein carrier protein
LRQLSYLIAGLLLFAVARAADTVDDDGETLVNAFVTDVVTFSGDFEQSLIDPDGRLLETTSGTLEIQRPGRFRWVYEEPYEQWLVADGSNIWSYDVDLEQVTVKPQADALANTPALLLGGSGQAMDQFEHGGSFLESGLTWVRLLPVDTDSGFRRVELGFDDGKLSRMVFLDNLEQTTVVVLKNVVVNEPIDAARFEFAVPDDVDVVGKPVAAKLTAD